MKPQPTERTISVTSPARMQSHLMRLQAEDEAFQKAIRQQFFQQ